MGLLPEHCTVQEINSRGFFRNFEFKACLAGFLSLPVVNNTLSHHLPP
jgi:hypothetical protein